MKKLAVVCVTVLLGFCLATPASAAWGRGEADEVASTSSASEKLMPKKAEIDTNGDGSVDRVETYGADGVIESVKSDIDFDGTYDEWLYYENGKLTKAAKDTDGDGKEDTWLTY